MTCQDFCRTQRRELKTRHAMFMAARIKIRRTEKAYRRAERDYLNYLARHVEARPSTVDSLTSPKAQGTVEEAGRLGACDTETSLAK